MPAGTARKVFIRAGREDVRHGIHFRFFVQHLYNIEMYTF
jgi:hypothetical protein